jgi:hypothetical protein
MKIISVFEDKLFALRYKNEEENEYDRLIELWNDTFYVRKFLKENEKDLPPNYSINELVDEIIDSANRIDDLLVYSTQNKDFDRFFKSLHNQEYKTKLLSKQKGRKNYLRIYALKIDANCYIITGGAIKFTLLMEDRFHTKQELLKIEKCRNYLKENGVIDAGSFYEFVNELL